VRFAGVELTSVGHLAAKRFQELPDLPAAMQAYAPLPLADTTAFRRIQFIQGNATSLPFDDDAFDLVFTSLAVEQMERVRHQALREIARVACRNTLMIEPFRDVNSSFWPRLNVRRRDYFRGRIRDLVGLGLKPVMTFDDFPQESFLKAVCVVAEKVRGNAASA
jgi:SAM-dependent methyltransferase